VTASDAYAGRGRVRDLFLRLLGLVFLAAFLSLLVQVRALFGADGLLPAASYLETIRGSFLTAPTIFQLDASDRTLVAAAVTGAVVSLGLVFQVAPRASLLALWVLYLSFVNVGQELLSFQWDNLLLETGFFAFFVTPAGLRPRHAPPPHAIAVFLMLWLVFRLNFESGAAKLLTGDPTWRDLTALEAYYETAPLPTWVGWWAHQLPAAFHRATAGYTLLVELVLTPLIWGPRLVRRLVVVAMLGMQASIILTANYGFFNYLTVVVTLWVLDDRDLAAVASAFGRTLVPAAARTPSRVQDAILALVAAVLVPLSVVPFLPFLGVRPPPALYAALDSVRSLNAYHLFAHMTLVRKEVVIEGRAGDGPWQAYELRYKPGDPDRAPPFVAPHQPRVDFQMWFLTLGGRARYFDRLLELLGSRPAAVASLFARDPFPDAPPDELRLAFYRYRFTDRATRRATGAWWSRESLGYSRPIGTPHR
jgi:hypothetical protein